MKFTIQECHINTVNQPSVIPAHGHICIASKSNDRNWNFTSCGKWNALFEEECGQNLISVITVNWKNRLHRWRFSCDSLSWCTVETTLFQSHIKTSRIRVKLHETRTSTDFTIHETKNDNKKSSKKLKCSMSSSLWISQTRGCLKSPWDHYHQTHPTKALFPWRVWNPGHVVCGLCHVDNILRWHEGRLAAIYSVWNFLRFIKVCGCLTEDLLSHSHNYTPVLLLLTLLIRIKLCD